ncbi:VOC family protein [Cellulomonas sp. URHD0024]|uniref:VOC family protein n=1 Tax=Cellulomonas sp. URHD0024 TaxID=1302620 RepID=UPI000684393A|nr:glyoxalase/bleomycin resistance/dioxygenase family protein [Cellulomonas sp. URHD0024]
MRRRRAALCATRAQPGYTVLGWRVTDIVATIADLVSGGVVMARDGGMEQDAQGVWTTPGGDRIAWFENPDGNVLDAPHRVRSTVSAATRSLTRNQLHQK